MNEKRRGRVCPAEEVEEVEEVAHKAEGKYK